MASKLVKEELLPQDLAISYHGQVEDGFYHAEKDNCTCLIKRVEVSKGLELEGLEDSWDGSIGST